MENAVVELSRNAAGYAKVVEEIVRMEKKIFPKHESLSKSFDSELGKKNAGLIYAHVNGEIAGYVMYSWPSSLSASITKLAAIQEQAHCNYQHRYTFAKWNLKAQHIKLHRNQLHKERLILILCQALMMLHLKQKLRKTQIESSTAVKAEIRLYLVNALRCHSKCSATHSREAAVSTLPQL